MEEVKNISETRLSRLESHYMNMAQLRATIVDSNVLIAEWGRATGKTEGVFGPRLIRVADSMPGEVSFLVHKTYAALLTKRLAKHSGIFLAARF
jgi:hypothetical protein